MNINEILDEKKSGVSLSKEEIDFIIYGYKTGKVSDGKMIDFMKIIDESNFSFEETYYLADAIARSGHMLRTADNVGLVVEKHSAGLVSDPTSLIFMSVMASLGVQNVKLLASEYGDYRNSLDRLKVFNGFNANISPKTYYQKIKKVGVGLIEQGEDIAPVDKMLYKLRKRAKIVSIPLIASSIIAKKIATGSSVLVFDVKTGEGALTQSPKYAQTLATYLVEVGKLAGFTCASVITNLDQPLGSCIGERTEMEEVLAVLRSDRALYDAKLLDVSRELVIVSLCLMNVVKGRNEAFEMFEEAISSGKALDKFKEIIAEYNGEYQDLKHQSNSLLDGVAVSYITAKDSGYISDIMISKLNEAHDKLDGEGRTIDRNAGIVLLAREGTKVNYGDKIVRIFYSISNKNFPEATNLIKEAVKMSKQKPVLHNVFYKVIV